VHLLISAPEAIRAKYGRLKGTERTDPLARLRPQGYFAMGEPSPLQRWPDVPADVIVCRDDRAINPGWVRASARERLGVDAVEIDGGHSPFLTRPAELAGLLDELAAD